MLCTKSLGKNKNKIKHIKKSSEPSLQRQSKASKTIFFFFFFFFVGAACFWSALLGVFQPLRTAVVAPCFSSFSFVGGALSFLFGRFSSVVSFFLEPFSARFCAPFFFSFSLLGLFFLVQVVRPYPATPPFLILPSCNFHHFPMCHVFMFMCFRCLHICFSFCFSIVLVSTRFFFFFFQILVLLFTLF